MLRFRLWTDWLTLICTQSCCEAKTHHSNVISLLLAASLTAAVCPDTVQLSWGLLKKKQAHLVRPATLLAVRSCVVALHPWEVFVSQRDKCSASHFSSLSFTAATSFFFFLFFSNPDSVAARQFFETKHEHFPVEVRLKYLLSKYLTTCSRGGRLAPQLLSSAHMLFVYPLLPDDKIF